MSDQQQDEILTSIQELTCEEDRLAKDALGVHFGITGSNPAHPLYQLYRIGMKRGAGTVVYMLTSFVEGHEAERDCLRSTVSGYLRTLAENDVTSYLEEMVNAETYEQYVDFYYDSLIDGSSLQCKMLLDLGKPPEGNHGVIA